MLFILSRKSSKWSLIKATSRIIISFTSITESVLDPYWIYRDKRDLYFTPDSHRTLLRIYPKSAKVYYCRKALNRPQTLHLLPMMIIMKIFSTHPDISPMVKSGKGLWYYVLERRVRQGNTIPRVTRSSWSLPAQTINYEIILTDYDNKDHNDEKSRLRPLILPR